MNRITTNWNLKLTALILAFALWGHVRGEVNPLETATFKVPLRAEAPPGFALLSKVPTTATVTLRGPRLTLRELRGGTLTNPLATSDDPIALSGEKVEARLSFQTPRAGEQNAGIKAETTIEELEVVKTNPDDLSVTLRENPAIPARKP